MAKNGSNFGARGGLAWLVVLAAVLAFVYYLYEGGKFSEGSESASGREDSEFSEAVEGLPPWVTEYGGDLP